MSQIEGEIIADQGFRITWNNSMLNKDAILYWLDEQIKVLEIRKSWADKHIDLNATLDCYRFLEKLIKEGKWDAKT